MDITTSSSKSDVYRGYITAINEKRYDDIHPYLHPTLEDDGETQTAEEHIKHAREEWAAIKDLTVKPDLIIEDDTEAAEDRPLAVRLLGRGVIGPQVAAAFGVGGLTGEKMVVVDHYTFIRFKRDAETKVWKISGISNMMNPMVLAEQLKNADAPEPNLSSDGIFSRDPVEPPSADFDLEQKARDWISWITHENIPSNGAGAADFLHDPLVKFGRPASRDEFVGQLAQHIGAFGNAECEIHSIVVNKEKQQVAIHDTVSGSSLDGTKLFGFPSKDGPVKMPQMLFYQFRDGKSAADWVVMDLNSLRK